MSVYAGDEDQPDEITSGPVPDEWDHDLAGLDYEYDEDVSGEGQGAESGMYD